MSCCISAACLLPFLAADSSLYIGWPMGYIIILTMNAKNMVLTWGPKCDFIFEEWSAVEQGDFWMGVALCFVTTFLTTAYGPIFHRQIKNTATSKLQLTFGYLLEYLLKLYVMLLMMTMNAPVCIAIALGVAIGYSVFGSFGESIRAFLFDRAK